MHTYIFTVTHAHTYIHWFRGGAKQAHTDKCRERFGEAKRHTDDTETNRDRDRNGRQRERHARAHTHTRFEMID